MRKTVKKSIRTLPTYIPIINNAKVFSQRIRQNIFHIPFINSRINEWGDHIRGWLINNEFLDKRKMTVITFDELKNKPFEVTKSLLISLGLWYLML